MRTVAWILSVLLVWQVPAPVTVVRGPSFLGSNATYVPATNIVQSLTSSDSNNNWGEAGPSRGTAYTEIIPTRSGVFRRYDIQLRKAGSPTQTCTLKLYDKGATSVPGTLLDTGSSTFSASGIVSDEWYGSDFPGGVVMTVGVPYYLVGFASPENASQFIYWRGQTGSGVAGYGTLTPTWSGSYGSARQLTHKLYMDDARTNVTECDFVVRPSTGSDGDLVTTTLLNAWDFGQSVTWTLNTSVTELKVSTPLSLTMAGVAAWGGTGSSDSGTHAFKVNCSIDEEYAIGTFAVSRPKVSFGAMIRLGTFTNSNAAIDPIGIAGGGEFLVCALLDDLSGAPKFRLHTSYGDGPNYTAANNTSYWITGLRDGPSGTAYLRIYDETGTTLLHSDSLTQNNVNATELRVGRIDSHAQYCNSDIYFGTIAVDYTGNAWPLLPP